MPTIILYIGQFVIYALVAIAVGLLEYGLHGRKGQK
jgi:hypothetical protein